jgi:hypothetical protein
VLLRVAWKAITINRIEPPVVVHAIYCYAWLSFSAMVSSDKSPLPEACEVHCSQDVQGLNHLLTIVFAFFFGKTFNLSV